MHDANIERKSLGIATSRGIADTPPLDPQVLELIARVLGKEDDVDVPEETLTAAEYYKQLDARLGSSAVGDGRSALSAFLLRARRAFKLVAEANDIIWQMKSKSLYFKLAMETPALAFGYGPQQLPEFCVHLLKKRPRAQALWARARLKLLKGTTPVGKSSMEFDARVVDLWTFTKFEAELQEMRAAYLDWKVDTTGRAFSFDGDGNRSGTQVLNIDHGVVMTAAIADLQKLLGLAEDYVQAQRRPSISSAASSSASHTVWSTPLVRHETSCKIRKESNDDEIEELRAELRRSEAENLELRKALEVSEEEKTHERTSAEQLRRLVDKNWSDLRAALIQEHKAAEHQELGALMTQERTNLEVKRLRKMLRDRNAEIHEAKDWQREAIARMNDMSEQLSHFTNLYNEEVSDTHKAADFVLQQLVKVNAAHAHLHDIVDGRQNPLWPATDSRPRSESSLQSEKKWSQPATGAALLDPLAPRSIERVSQEDCTSSGGHRGKGEPMLTPLALATSPATVTTTVTSSASPKVIGTEALVVPSTLPANYHLVVYPSHPASSPLASPLPSPRSTLHGIVNPYASPRSTLNPTASPFATPRSSLGRKVASPPVSPPPQHRVPLPYPVYVPASGATGNLQVPPYQQTQASQQIPMNLTAVPTNVAGTSVVSACGQERLAPSSQRAKEDSCLPIRGGSVELPRRQNSLQVGDLASHSVQLPVAASRQLGGVLAGGSSSLPVREPARVGEVIFKPMERARR